MRIKNVLDIMKSPSELPANLEWQARKMRGGLRRAYRAAYRGLFGLPTIALETLAPPLPNEFSPIPDYNCMPPHAGSSEHDDLEPLLRIIKRVNPKKILELGTAHGNTVANICRVCNAHIWTVNALPEQMSGEFVTFALSKVDIGKVYREHGYEERVTQIYANTFKLDLTHYISRGSIDFVIIDACHDKSYVINDFQVILPTLSDKATVLFHDTHPSMEKHLVGSYMACMRLRLQGYDVRHIAGTWWGIWQKDTK